MNFDLDRPFREYRPYDPTSVRCRRLNHGAPNADELRNMDAFCESILDRMTLGQYVSARRGLATRAAEISSILADFSIPIAGRVLEFGAGTCKLSAVLSRIPDVESLVCLDFSETLLTEIASRVISYLDGSLSKIEFMVGDMNRIDEVPGLFDWIVCYGAVHHLTEPERFFARAGAKLAPGGRILCLDEPTLPEIVLPHREIRAYLDSVRKKRALGENENVYRMSQYRRMARPWFNLQDLTRTKYQRLLRYWSPLVFKANFILVPA